MSEVERLQIAQHMSAGLRRELGEGIDGKRMLAQPLYARDVLLVCLALRDTELPELATRFSALGESARTSQPPAPEAASPDAGADSASADLGDSTLSGWRPSLWPSTMRAGLFSGHKAEKPGAGRPGKPRR